MPVQNAFINATDPPQKLPKVIYTAAEASLPPYEVTAIFYY